jgi:LDH2 family malate/lactate/ureidoglycolate dehydrogenase
MSRVPAAALTELATALLAAAGLAPRHAACYAEKIVAADLLGHGSHGLRLLPRSLDELRRGDLTGDGDPDLVADHGACLLIDGRMLPGPVVVVHAVERALGRIGSHGTVLVSIRRAGHIRALCTYLEMATTRGLMMLIASSNPWARLVAPFGGTRPVYSPNPIAFGFPTPGDPVLMDFSASTIAANAVQEYRARGEALPGKYLLDADGQPTDDPRALGSERPGSILPLGGADLGHKGFGLGLMVEALTAGLSGFGRSSAPATTSNAVFLMILDPQAFAGRDWLLGEAGALIDACHAAAGAGRAVRLPGERALAHRRQALRDGVEIGEPLKTELLRRASALGVTPPAGLAAGSPC